LENVEGLGNSMKYSVFTLEEWFDRYEFKVDHLLGSSSCAGMTVNELFDLTGETIDFGKTRLTAAPVGGLPELQEAIATWYKNTSPGEVFVTCSSTEAIFLLVESLVGAGDSVVAMFPMYPALYQLASDIGAEVRKWRLRHENQFRPDFAELEELVDETTKLIVINNPQNPTGNVMSDEELRRVIAVADRAGAKVWVDEVFRGITVDSNPATASVRDLDQSTISSGSMSKSFGLSGLRVGWIAAPKEVLDSLWHIRYYTTVCAATIDQQIAALAHRFRDVILARNQAIVDENFGVLQEWMAEKHDIFDWVKPLGGPITFPKFIPDVDTDEFCLQLAEKYSVLVPPGNYTFDAEGFIRIGYGMRRFGEAMEIVSGALDEYF